MAFSDNFSNPPREFTVIPFWFLNDDLNDEELRRQIDDFAAHGVYGFIPHARLGLPSSIPFMSERWLHFIRVCVEHAAEKQMLVYLYDEGMYPSGSCAGQVAAANPRYATRCLERQALGAGVGQDEEVVAEDEHWAYVHRRSMGRIRGVHFGTDDGEAGAPLSADLLNPESVDCFLHLVCDGYYAALERHFGTTVRGIFTDEPDLLGRGSLGDVRPWTWGLEGFLEDALGYDFRPHLGALWDEACPDAARYRADFERAVNRRLLDAYYARYGAWCEAHGVALTGHPAKAGDLAALAHFQLPGQDIVWRWIEPYKPNALEGEQSTTAKCALSAQRHYGRARNAVECFGAYGWEFTYDEMRWLTNWMLVRGVNLLIPHAFYYSLRGERRNERPPDVGPNSAWWESYEDYADYCRRLCWLLATGSHVCHFAILGGAERLPWCAAKALFQSQRDFNYLGRDTLLSDCAISATGVAIRDMAYRGLVIDGPEYASPELLSRLKPLIDAGRVVAYGDPVPEVPQVAANAQSLVAMLDKWGPPDVTASPKALGLRYIHVRHSDSDLYLFANEGPEAIDVDVRVAASGAGEWWDPQAAALIEDTPSNRLVLDPLTTRVLRLAR